MAAILPFELGKIFEATAYVGFGYLIAQACDIRKWDRLDFSHKLGAFLVFTVAFLILEHFSAAQPVATGAMVVPEFLRTLVFARPRGDDQFADCTFSPSLDMSR